MRKLTAFFCLLLLIPGCSTDRGNSATPSTPKDEQPQGSSLPAPGPSGDPYCPDVDEADWRGYEPKLSAWLHVADSVFVGTISSVEHVKSPVYLREGPSDFTVISGGASDCPTELQPAIRISFEDVEVLHGDSVANEFSIQMGGDLAPDYPGISLMEGDSHPRDLNGDSVYFPGTRIGAALFRDKNGELHWRYRQFEVINGNVQLQAIDDDAVRMCWAEPQLIGIPDAYDGVPFADLKAAITDANTQLAADDLDAVNARHQDFADDLQRDSYLLAQEAYCWPPDPDDTEDPAVPNDPDHNP